MRPQGKTTRMLFRVIGESEGKNSIGIVGFNIQVAKYMFMRMQEIMKGAGMEIEVLPDMTIRSYGTEYVFLSREMLDKHKMTRKTINYYHDHYRG